VRVSDAPPTTCPNCGAPQAGRFCPACGQDNGRLKLRLTTSLLPSVQALFSVDGALWRTLRGLTTRPGRVAREYLDGKRVRYVHPVRYAFLTCGIWWGVLNLVLHSQLPPEQFDQLPGPVRHGAWLNLGMVPILAFGMWLPFLGGRRSWLEVFYVLLFAFGHSCVWRAGMAALGPLLPPSWARPVQTVDALGFLLFTAWTFWGAWRGHASWLGLRLIGAMLALAFGSSLLVGLAYRVL